MPGSVHRPRGPRGAHAHTRQDILDAALRVFMERGYERASMRAIAREAGVDAALPRHYFDSKSDLFVQALGPIDQVGQRVAHIVDGPRESTGERMVANFAAVWDAPTTGPRLLTILRSAASVPSIARVLSGLVVGRVALPVARTFGDAGADERAAAAASQLVGLAMARHVLEFEPVASATGDELVAWFGPTLQALISGQPPSATRSSS